MQKRKRHTAERLRCLEGRKNAPRERKIVLYAPLRMRLQSRQLLPRLKFFSAFFIRVARVEEDRVMSE